MNDECPFCQIIARKREADIVYEDGTLVAFKDMYPHAPIHLLIVPKKHIRSINDLTPEDKDIVAGMLMKAPEIAKQMSVARSGYKLLITWSVGQARWFSICTCI